MSEPLLAGIEAGGTKFICALGRADGTLVECTRIATRDPHTTIAGALAFFTAAAKTHGKPVALGIASFGPVELDVGSPTYGHLLRTPKPGWNGTDMVTPFAQALGIPLAIDTDVNAAALAECALGAGVGLDALAYVTVGTGIGGGVVSRGAPLHGLLHPELGHLRPRRHPLDNGFAGICPYHGDCFEGLASGPAIVARIGCELGDAPPDHAIWDIEADYLGQLCALLVLAVSPRRIVLGGGVMQHARLFPALRAYAQHWLGGYVARPEVEARIDAYITPPGLGQHSGILGALVMAADCLDNPR